MTTIAWDGKTLAADRQACIGSTTFAVTKLFRVGDRLVAAAGDFDRINEMVNWIRNGSIPESLPVFQRSNDDFVGVLVVETDGTLFKYERSPFPYKIEAEYHAIGSGREYATAALYLGKTAREAVEIAIALDPQSGIGIDCISLNQGEDNAT